MRHKKNTLFLIKKAFIDTGKGFNDTFLLYFMSFFDKISKVEERVALRKGRVIHCVLVKIYADYR
jgi:hypothetical protein